MNSASYLDMKNQLTDAHGLLHVLPEASATPTVAPTRREALKSGMAASIGVGFAAAAAPTSAQTAIRTDRVGVTVGEVFVDVKGFKMPVVVAKPASGSNWPVVLVIQEIFGVHEYIADVAVRFAKLGYLAIAPELFERQGDPRAYGEIAKIQSEIVSKVPDAQVMGDLDACVAWAGQNGSNAQRVGITGFCWGGRITWLYAAHNPAVKAGVAWYGRLVGNATANTPRHAVDVAADLKAPVLGLYGSADTGIPMDTVERMKTALAAAGSNPAAKASGFHVYDGAPHAFHADYLPSYRKEAAEDGWKRATAWFKANGV